MTIEEQRRQFLSFYHREVPFEGWGDFAFKAASRKLGIDYGLASCLFPRGSRDVLSFASEEADRAMAMAMADHGNGTKVRERIALGVRLRISLEEREIIRRVLTFLALPNNAGLGLRLLMATVDAIWVATGDRPTDFSYYTKRAVLAGVYSTTLIYWLADYSQGSEASWSFLSRCLDNAQKFPQLFVLSRNFVTPLTERVSFLLKTNSNRRL